MKLELVNYNTKTGNINLNASENTVEMYLVPKSAVSEVLTYSVTSNPDLEAVNVNDQIGYENWKRYLKSRLRLSMAGELLEQVTFEEIKQEHTNNIEFRCDFSVIDLNS